MSLKFSKLIQEALAELEEAGGDPSELSASSCTSGYNNDGSTGFDIFENGYQLGQEAGDQSVWHADSNDVEVVYFFIGDEKDIVVKIKAAHTGV